MPPAQTEHNKAGHAKALALGFESCGPGVYGWRDAKVRCTTCGHPLPWYQHVYQVQHRATCVPKVTQALTGGRLYLGAAGTTPVVDVGAVFDVEVMISPLSGTVAGLVPGELVVVAPPSRQGGSLPLIGLWSLMTTASEEDPCCDGCEDCDGGGY